MEEFYPSMTLLFFRTTAVIFLFVYKKAMDSFSELCYNIL